MDLNNLNMDAIGDILNSMSAEDMEGLKSVAQNFFSNSNTQEQPKSSEKESNENSQEKNEFNLDFESIAKITSIMNKLSSRSKDPRSDLLTALRPLLSEKRQSKVDQANKIIQLLEILPLLKDMG